MFTAAELHELSGLGSRTRSEPVSQWQKEAKTFGICVGQPYLYPAFQFRDGRPRKGRSRILSALPNDMTSWQNPLWFASVIGWLGGVKPEQRLEDVNLVVEAAKQLSRPVHG